MRLRRVLFDEGGQIVGRVIKYGLVVAVAIFLLAEVGPLIWYRISQLQDAEDIASAAAQEYGFDGDEDRVRGVIAEKLSMMGYSDEEIIESSVVFLPPGTVQKTKVRVTLVKYANTLVTRHIGQLKRFARVATTKEAEILSSKRR